MIFWKIENMERILNNGFVIIVHWACIAKDEVTDKSYRVYGSYPFQYNPEQDNFIPYNQLTEEIVIDWIKEALGEEKVSNYELAVQSELNNILNPTKEFGIPWN